MKQQIIKIATKGCGSGKTEKRKMYKMGKIKDKNNLQCKKQLVSGSAAS